MAKKRKSTKVGAVRRRSRRRVSGLGSTDLMDVLYLIGGAVASRALVNAVGSKIDIIGKSSTNKAAAQLALGFLLPMVVKNPMVKSMGNGAIAGGGYELFKGLAPSALGATDDGEVIMITGLDDDISTIQGLDQLGALDINTVNGVDDIDDLSNI